MYAPSRLEQTLCNQLQLVRHHESRTISASTNAGERVSAAFLRWFLIEAIPATGVSAVKIELEGAEIDGDLKLDGATVTALPRFIKCKFKSIYLSDAKIIGLEIAAGEVVHIRADRLTAEGAIEIRQKFKEEDSPEIPLVVKGQLRLNGAKIRGNLNLTGCNFTGEHPRRREPILFADGLVVEGNVLLIAPFSSKGEIGLNGCDIHRNLDCSGATLRNLDRYTLSAAGAHVAGSVYLCETQPWSSADSKNRRRFSSEGCVRFDGAEVDGDFDCRGGKFTAAAVLLTDWRHKPGREFELYSISAAGIHVAGSMYLRETELPSDKAPQSPFESRGLVRIQRAKVDGTLDCKGGRFTARAFTVRDWQRNAGVSQEIYAIAAGGIQVGANVSFQSDQRSHNKFCATGFVDLINARVGGDFDCHGGNFSFPGEETLCADGIAVTGSTFLNEIETDGIVRFAQADLKQGFYIKGATFDGTKEYRAWQEEPNLAMPELGGKACGIYAPLAKAGGTFFWKGTVVKPGNNLSWLSLPGAQANEINDDQESWDRIEKLDVTGCQYAGIRNLGGDQIWRLRRLDVQYAELNGTFSKGWGASLRALWRAAVRKINCLREKDKGLTEAIARFKPQPYIQLAATFRRAGYESAASEVLVKLERNKTRYSDFGILRQLGRWLLDLFLLYGHSPFRPVLYLIVWAAVSTLVFAHADRHHRFVFIKEVSQSVTPGRGTPAPPRPSFNPFIYSIDTLVPIVDFNQKKSWIIDPMRNTYGALLVFNTFFGWMMTTLFAAGVTGLLRTGRAE